MIWLALVLLGPLGAGLAIFALRRAPATLTLAGAGGGLIGALGLFVVAAGGRTVRAALPFLPDFPILFVADMLTATVSLTVATVAASILIYAAGYMRDDPERARFLATMLLFVTAMQALVLSGDWITLLAAWEMIGFASYLLIGFWHRRDGVAGAATRAFLYTRSADLGLYIAAFLLIGVAGTSEISATLATTGTPALIAGILALVAAAGKSAQVPMQDWLMRAMAGPTPVSALLHSATLVAAGAILLIRAAPMLPAGALLAIALLGGVTTVVTGLMALAERDLKRLLAASTASQYGLMLVAVGAGAPVAALLHLIAHAAIKSSLFLGAGIFQHDRDGTGFDVLAGAGRARPGVFAGFALSALALAGLPPFAAYVSKDAILAAALASPLAPWLLPLALAGSLLTGAYMGRALMLLWRGDAGATRASVPVMAAGMGVLVALAAMLGVGFSTLERLLGAEMAEAGWIVPVMGLAVGLGGLALGAGVTPARLLGPLHAGARRGFAVFGGMDGMVARPVLWLAARCEALERRLYAGVLAIGRAGLSLGSRARQTDSGGIDALIFGFVAQTVAVGTRARRLQSGFIHRELALTALGIAAIVVALVAAPFLF